MIVISVSLRKLLLTVFVLTIAIIVVQAQESKLENDTIGEISLSGSVDVYYHKSLVTLEEAPRTSFANLPGFSLGMIDLIGSYTGKKSGFVVDLVFGPRGSDAIFNAPLHTNPQGGGSAQIINQMFVYYQFSKNVRINLGQFNTFLGYEAISPLKNFHYSTSYLFSYGPFNHTGVWTDITLSDGWSAKLALMNPTDYTEYNPFDSYTVGGQIGFARNDNSLYLNITDGDPDGKIEATDSVGTVSWGNAFQIDLTACLSISKKYSIGLNTSYRTVGSGEIQSTTHTEKSTQNNHGFYGVALYQKILFNDSFSMGLRTEYFTEFNKGVGAMPSYSDAGKASVIDLTLSANLRSANFNFIPEVRFDKTSMNSFTKKSTGSSIDHMISSNFAVVYCIPKLSHTIRNKKQS